jgi:hypothetical protein
MHHVLAIGAHEPKTIKEELISNFNNQAIVSSVMATISLSFLTEWHPPLNAPFGPCKEREEDCELVLRTFALTSLFAFVLSALGAVALINAITLVPVLPDGTCAITTMVHEVGPLTRLPQIGQQIGLCTMMFGTCVTAFIYGPTVGMICTMSAGICLICLAVLMRKTHAVVLKLNLHAMAELGSEKADEREAEEQLLGA